MTTTEESQKPTIVSSNAIAYKDVYAVQESIIELLPLSSRLKRE